MFLFDQALQTATPYGVLYMKTINRLTEFFSLKVDGCVQNHSLQPYKVPFLTGRPFVVQSETIIDCTHSVS